MFNSDYLTICYRVDIMILAYTLIYKNYFFDAIALCTKFRPSFSRIPLSFRGGLYSQVSS